MPTTPAPYCRVAIGAIEMTFVPDGFGTSNPREWFSGGSEDVWDTNPQLLDEKGRLVMSLGAILVSSGGKLGLIDLGWGPPEDGSVAPASQDATSKRGELVDNLRRLGVGADEIDLVLFSHLHGDHIGWLVDPDSVSGDDPSSGQPMFPNAQHCLSEPEMAYWTEEAAGGSTRAPSAAQLSVLGSRARIVSGGEMVMPGVEAVETFGHTPGHLSFALASGDERALVLGDAVHCPVEMLEPEMSFAIDVDPDLAKRTRAHLAASLADSGDLAVAPHFPDFVFGRLLKSERRPTWHFPESQVLSIG